jgi:hypothetical protein
LTLPGIVQSEPGDRGVFRCNRAIERRQYRIDRHLMVIEASDASGAHCDFEPSYGWDE